MAYTNNNGQTRIGVRSGVLVAQTPSASTLWNSIYAVYNGDSVGSSSLKTSLFAAYNGESNANDSFGTNNGTAVGGLTYTTGKIGNAFNFNGSNSYVELPNNSLNFTGDFSVSLWLYRQPLAGGMLVSNWYNGSTPYGWYIYNTNGVIKFLVGNGTSSPVCSFNSSVLTSNVWNFVTVTKTATSAKIYINGVLNTSATLSSSVVYTTTHYPMIGAAKYDTGLPNFLSQNGDKIDAVNVWQKELTASEVSELYNSGNGAQYITNDFYKPTTNDALNTYNGTAQGGLTYGVGKVGTAFVGNGTNAYITLANNSFKFTNSQSFSISTWVNITNSNVNNIIFSSWLYSGVQGYGWLLRTTPYSSTQCNLDFITDWQASSGTPIPLSVSNAFTINTWVFVTATRNGSTGVEKIYVNGSQIATRTLTPNYLYTSNTVYPSILAQKYDSSSVSGYLNGRIDAVGIWNKELTSAEVTELYNSGNGKQYPN